MKAIAIFPGQKNSVHLRDIQTPDIKANEVLIRSIRCGICGTDREINEGLYGTAPLKQDYLVLGHESSGIVEKIGDAVSGIAIGDYVVRSVRRPCPTCDNCNHGANDMCTSGNFVESGIKELNGCMAEYFVDDPAYLIKINQELAHTSVLLEPISVVEKAWRQAKAIQQRLYWRPQKALIMGAGPIGLLQAMLLKEEGLDVAVVARSQEGNLKSTLVRAIGAQYYGTVTTSLDAIKEDFGNIDLIVEASGSAAMAFEAMNLVGLNGVVCLTSITGGKGDIKIPADKINLDYVLGNKVVFGTVNANLCDYQRGVHRLEKFMSRWPEVVEQIFTRRVPLSQYLEAFRSLSEDIKTTIEFS
jgi:threonine dehydrogenase-like Zn-dependent dehydrogenase